MQLLKGVIVHKMKKYEKFELTSENKPEYDVRNDKDYTQDYVFDSYEKNLSYINKRYSISINNDIVIRKILLKNDIQAFIIFYDGMVDSDAVNNNIIKSLIELPFIENEVIVSEISEKFTTHNQVSLKKGFDEICDEINFGSCALFIDGISEAFVFDVRSWEHRSIDKPENEQSIYGPQEAFGEMLRTNTALIRKIIKNEKLIAEGITVGNQSKTRGVLLYINGIANDKLIYEAKRRIEGISIDYVIGIEQVQMLIEDRTMFVTPQILATERPDRAARALSEGRCVLVLNGSPRVLIMPSNAFELTHTVSDEYLNVPFSLMSRIVRLVGMFLSLLLPALYLAITLYHHEIIPTYLLYSISAARENVPFPSIVELLLMDISFELIREAGIRMPSPVGSTLGIVGGLILGQAAVSAKIVSPLMIIVIAITGIGSFTASDYTLGWTYRVLRLAFIGLAAILGLYGIALGIILYSLYIGNITTFGIPFLEPEMKLNDNSMSSAVKMNKIWSKEKRPHFLKTKNDKNEDNISRKWLYKNRYKR